MRVKVDRLARAVDDIDFSNATTATLTEPAAIIDGELELPFNRPLTPTELDAVMLRLTSASEAEALERQASTEYLALASPTATDVAAQTRVNTRLLLRLIEHVRGA